MTRTVIAVAALALAARASATNGPKPEKAVGKKGCDICSGGTVDAYAHAGGFCKIDDDVFDLNVTEAECYHDHSNSWISRTCGEVAQEYMEANLNATECKSGQEFAASLCCSDTGGGNAANSPRPTSKPTGQSRGSGPGDGNDGNGTESESLVYAIDRCFDRRALRRRDTVFTQVHADRRRAPSRLLNVERIPCTPSTLQDVNGRRDIACRASSPSAHKVDEGHKSSREIPANSNGHHSHH